MTSVLLKNVFVNYKVSYPRKSHSPFEDHNTHLYTDKNKFERDFEDFKFQFDTRTVQEAAVYGLYQFLCTNRFDPVDKDLLKFGFVDEHMLQFESETQREEYINKVYKPFALRKIQEGNRFHSLEYYSKREYIKIRVHDMKQKAGEIKQNRIIRLIDFKYQYTYCDSIEEAIAHHEIQELYHANHEHIFTDEELERYIGCFNWFQKFDKHITAL